MKRKENGQFGEANIEVSERLKLKDGVSYNNDKKTVIARSTLAAFLATNGGDGTVFDSPFVKTFDADTGTPGNQLFQERTVKFNKLTGRAAIDFKVTDDNLIYAYYSRGYK